MKANEYFIQTNGYGEWQNIGGAVSFEHAVRETEVLQAKYPGTILRIVPLAVIEGDAVSPVYYWPFVH